jgi:hypothetical protein
VLPGRLPVQPEVLLAGGRLIEQKWFGTASRVRWPQPIIRISSPTSAVAVRLTNADARLACSAAGLLRS